MKARTEEEEEIRRFKEALHSLVERYHEYQEKKKNDEYYERFGPFFGPHEGHLLWPEEAPEYRPLTRGECAPIGYTTSSGKGRYWVEEKKEVLFFEGYRNSFKDGSSFLRFHPSREGGWAVIETTAPERGPFE